MNAEQISLYFSEGSSDKEYHAKLKAQDGGYVVLFQYGRRGAAMQSGAKTSSPIEYDKAKKVYDKLVQEKMSKGYSTGLSGAAYQDTPKSSEFTGILPQLLNPVEESEAHHLIHSHDWIMQEKFDGKRIMCHRTSEGVTGINRKGLRVALPQSVADEIGKLPHDSIVDGELIGERYFVFDFIRRAGHDLANMHCDDRFSALNHQLTESGVTGSVTCVEVFTTPEHKRAAFDRIRAADKEGVVFKRVDSRYAPGRPNSGGDQVKFKFVETASVFVTARNSGKRSVAVGAFDASGNQVALGSVTIPPNYAIPDENAVIDVLYLYAFESGSLFQPVYRGERSDEIDLAACVMSQLKFKPMAVAA